MNRAANAHRSATDGWIDRAEYERLYTHSVTNPESFWAEAAKRFLAWQDPWSEVLRWDFSTAEVRWFSGATLNASVNCLDRHVTAGFGNQTAILWEGNDPAESRQVTYRELLDQVCQAANALKALGIRKGDRVCIYMQMIPELVISMLACARIGAVHSVVFGAFSAEVLRGRIIDSRCRLVLTQDSAVRGTKTDIPMKANVDRALEPRDGENHSVERVMVVQRTGHEVFTQSERDLWWHDIVHTQSTNCAPEWMEAESPLFTLYTSGSTGRPKGLLHTTAGYLLQSAMTHHYVFGCEPTDRYFCTADIGWITGHSYVVYGPLANRSTVVMFEGVPNFPDFGRFWAICEKYKVSHFYTAPTALRALMKEGDAWPKHHDLSSLQVLGTVGEPIKSAEWNWYATVIGGERCPIVDTWWQTETGGIMISPLPGTFVRKPGSATKPFFGVQPVLVDDSGAALEEMEATGNLCIQFPWPGMARTIYGDHERFKSTYFTRFPGLYFSGDGCRRDRDGDYWITGRVDDVINVSGHRFGTAEIEGAIGRHPQVAEAAVVGYPHDIKGTGIYAFVTLKTGGKPSDDLLREIDQTVRSEIGPIASPDLIHFSPNLPKTRSGKIMRRILRKIAEGHTEMLGDTSTLADPGVIDDLIRTRPHGAESASP